MVCVAFGQRRTRHNPHGEADGLSKDRNRWDNS